MKRSCQSNPTHINKLPLDIVESILGHVPIQDAVRTSVLSKKWRYAWRKLPQLVFDDRFCDTSIINTQSKLIMAIYQVLLLHRGPLQKFTLALSKLKSCSEIDQFVLVVLEAGVKDFTLRIQKGEPYRLSSSLFVNGQQLESLMLRSCVIHPSPEFNGFSKLEQLVLINVGIDDNKLSSLVSNCPQLKLLYIRSSIKCACLEIVAPNLKRFHFDGLCESLCFKNTPELELVQLFISKFVKNDQLREEIEASKQLRLFGRLPVLENLAVSLFYAKHMIATTSLVNDLCNLKTLTLMNTCFGILDEVVTALCLIRNCKKLEQLTIRVKNQNNAQDIELEEVEGSSDVTLEHLREMKFLQVSGQKCELQLIKLILANSQVLEKFVIKPASSLVGDRRLMFFKELLRFRRASPLVEIVYED